MPQVWLTYEELGEMMKREPSEIRIAVIQNDWPRRRSGDGLVRVKLSPTLAHEFMLAYAALNGQTAPMASGAKAVGATPCYTYPARDFESSAAA
jgi:hypothetical protein